MTAKLETGWTVGAGIVSVIVPVAVGICPSVTVNTISPGAALALIATPSDRPSVEGFAVTLVGSETDQVGTSPEGSVVALPVESRGIAVKTVV